MRLSRFLASGCVALLMAISPAWAERKLALVIGINKYENVTSLEKAVGDAKAMGKKLETMGYDVTTVFDADRRKLNEELASLYDSIKPGDTVFIHYSGHGIELDGQNYLLPSDVPSPESGRPELLKSESLLLANLTDTLRDKGAATRILIIDACRDNPYAKAGKRSLGNTRGLAEIKPTKGTFVMFSAGAGQAALDRLSDNDNESTSVFMRVLLRSLDKPNVKLRDLAAELKEEVETLAESVNHQQRPGYYDDLPSNFMLLQTAALEPANGGSTGNDVSPPPLVDPDAKARALWESSMSMDSPQVFDQIAMLYPDSSYAALARARAKELRDLQAAKKKAAAEKAKRDKLAEEQRLREEEQRRKEAANGEPATEPEVVPSKVYDLASLEGELRTEWAVVAGTFSLDREAEAIGRAGELRANGFSSAIIVRTSDYPRLKPGLLAVVVAAKSEQSAKSVVVGVKQMYPDAYTRKVR